MIIFVIRYSLFHFYLIQDSLLYCLLLPIYYTFTFFIKLETNSTFIVGLDYSLGIEHIYEDKHELREVLTFEGISLYDTTFFVDQH